MIQIVVWDESFSTTQIARRAGVVQVPRGTSARVRMSLFVPLWWERTRPTSTDGCSKTIVERVPRQRILCGAVCSPLYHSDVVGGTVRCDSFSSSMLKTKNNDRPRIGALIVLVGKICDDHSKQHHNAPQHQPAGAELAGPHRPGRPN